MFWITGPVGKGGGSTFKESDRVGWKGRSRRTSLVLSPEMPTLKSLYRSHCVTDFIHQC